MFTIGPTLYSGSAGHDLLTVFQCTMAGGSSEDVAQFHTGPGTVTGAYVTKSAGNLNVSQTTTNVSHHSWSTGYLSPVGRDFCLEMMFTLAIPAGRPTQQKIGAIYFGTILLDMHIENQDPPGSGVQKLKLYESHDAFSMYSVGDVLSDPSWQHHVALIYRAPGPNCVDIYIDGNRVAQDYIQTDAGPHGNQWGAAGKAGENLQLNMKGMRGRRAQVYPDTPTITPPTTVADWGPP